RSTVGGPRYVLNPDGSVRREGTLRPLARPLARWPILRHSALACMLADAGVAPRTSDGEVALYLGLIGAMRAGTLRRGADFIVVFIRSDPEWFSGSSYSNESVIAEIRRTGARLLDMSLLDTEGKLPSEYVLHPLDSHPSAAANRERAAMLYRELS